MGTDQNQTKKQSLQCPDTLLAELTLLLEIRFSFTAKHHTKWHKCHALLDAIFFTDLLHLKNNNSAI